MSNPRQSIRYVRSPLVGRLRVLENPRHQLSASANGLVPGSASVAALDAVSAGGPAPLARCAGATTALGNSSVDLPAQARRGTAHRTGQASCDVPAQ
jgi:hypothetical protein